MTARESPFDPFTFDDDKDDGRAPTPAGALTISQQSTKSFGTVASKRSQKRENVSEEKIPKALPPRLNVRLTLHEEVSSMAILDPEGEGGSLSQVSIEGKVMALVKSPNVNENIPFCLKISGPMAPLATITCHDHCALEADEDATMNTPFSRGGKVGEVRCKVDIPKSDSEERKIMSYSMNVRTQNMPMLVQAKAAVVKEMACRVSVQIRSNLSNQGDLSNFTIVVAIPTTLKGDTLKITRGDYGIWDANKRIITWKIGNLPHGESCLVSAEADLTSSVVNVLRDNPFEPQALEGKIRCPVLVRCLSEVDQVSDLVLTAVPLERSPARVVQQQMKSYQLLHRVGKTGV